MAKLTRNKINRFKEIRKHTITFNVDSKPLDVTIYDTVDSDKVQSVISEMLALNEFRVNNKNYSGLDDNLVAMMIILKHLTDLPYETKETTEENLIELINVTSILSNKNTDVGLSIFKTVAENIDPSVVDAITDSINKAVEIVNNKIGDINA